MTADIQLITPTSHVNFYKEEKEKVKETSVNKPGVIFVILAYLR